jgi:hypothetical protein
MYLGKQEKLAGVAKEFGYSEQNSTKNQRLLMCEH